MLKNHLGEEYVVTVIQLDGIRCRFCFRVIRVREKAALFTPKKGKQEFECQECVKAGRDTRPVEPKENADG